MIFLSLKIEFNEGHYFWKTSLWKIQKIHLKYVRINDNKVTMEIGDERGGNKYIFDLSKGGNMVYHGFQHEERRNASEKTIEWINIDGIFVPDRYEHKVYDAKGTKKTPLYTKTVRFTEHHINKPIDPDIFKLKGLGLRKNDQIMDSRIGIKFRPSEMVFKLREIYI